MAIPAIRALASPPVVSLNESSMLRAAAAIDRGQLRSGRIRAMPNTPSPTPVSSPRPPRQEVQVNMVEIPVDNEPSPEVQQPDLMVDDLAASQGLIESMFGIDDHDDDDENEEALDTFNTGQIEPVIPHLARQTTPIASSTPPPPEAPAPEAPAPAASASTPLVTTRDETVFAGAQVADQPRIPTDWPVSGRALDQNYVPTAIGKWWNAWAQENPDKPKIFSHIGRIMETDIGMQLFDGEKCTRCQQEGLECWVYDPKYTQRVKYAGTNCARCRALPVFYGCSHAKRKRNGGPLFASSLDRPRYILPRGPDRFDPGAGAAGALVGGSLAGVESGSQIT